MSLFKYISESDIRDTPKNEGDNNNNEITIYPQPTLDELVDQIISNSPILDKENTTLDLELLRNFILKELVNFVLKKLEEFLKVDDDNLVIAIN